MSSFEVVCLRRDTFAGSPADPSPKLTLATVGRNVPYTVPGQHNGSHDHATKMTISQLDLDTIEQ